MPNTFYYLRGALNEQLLVARHGDLITEAITCLLTGDYTAKNLEKLKGHPVYSFRINDAARFLFTTRRVGDADYLLVLDYLPTHDYHKSRFLRSGVLRDYLARQEPGELEFTAVSVEEIAALPMGASGEAAHGIALDYYHQQFIELNDSQQAALQVPLPAVISGVAGSGKSCIALSLLSSYVSDNPIGAARRIVYVTQSEPLVASMLNAWQQLPVAVDTEDTVEFISYAELVRQQLDVSAPPLVDKAAFEAWYDGDSAQSVYEELRICSGYDKAAYLALGQRQSLVAPEARADIYALYQRYLAYQATHGYDTAFYPLRSAPLYDLVVVDEAQDLSHGANQNLRHLARENGIVYCLDSLQQLHDRQSIRPYLLESLRVDEGHHVQLTTTHRCPRRVVAVANVVVALKHRLVGGISDKYEPTEIKGDHAIDGDVHLYSERELAASDWLSATKGTQFAVITEAAHREQARQLFQTELVMTPEEIKGLEYPIVVAYRLYPEEDFKKIHKRINTVGEKQPTHRAKAGESHDEFAPLMNRIYSSYMRTQQTLIICEQPSRNNDCLLTPIKQLTQAAPFTGECVSQQATPADWSREVMRQLEKRNRELAKRVFLQHQLGTEADFNALLPESVVQPVVPPKPRQNTKPVAVALSREETREEKAAKQLIENFEPLDLEASLKTYELKPLLLRSYHGQTLLQFIQQDAQRAAAFFALIVNDLRLLDKLANARLSTACKSGEFKNKLKFLESLLKTLDWKADLAVLLDDKITPLICALMRERKDIVRTLVDLGADVNKIIKAPHYPDIPTPFFLAGTPIGLSLLAENEHRLLNLITAESLNHLITTGPEKDKSFAYILASEDKSRYMLAENNFRLLNLINVRTLNHIITATPFAGRSVAYCLVVTDEGRELLAQNDYHLADLINSNALNSICSHASERGASIAYWLARTNVGRSLLVRKNHRLLDLINADALNSVCSHDSDAGGTVAFYLVAAPGGHAMLARNDYRLLDLINAKTLNHIISTGPNAGISIAHVLAQTPAGLEMLARNEYRLLHLITVDTLNHVITQGSTAVGSVASFLASTPKGQELLTILQAKLASSQTVSQEETREEKAVKALFKTFNPMRLKISMTVFEPEPLLLRPHNGQTLLQFIQQDAQRMEAFFAFIVNDLELLKKLSNARLSTACDSGEFKDNLEFLESLLSTLELINQPSGDRLTPLCLAISRNAGTAIRGLIQLGADMKNALDTVDEKTIKVFLEHNLMTADVLNHVIRTGQNAGLTVAFRLARTVEGRALLTANQNHLISLLSQETLNQVIAAGPNAGRSVAFWLAGTPDGRVLLAANQNCLVNLLTQEALNHVIAVGPNAGESVAYWLARSPDGRAMLAANQYRLANLLSQETLNHVIVAGSHAGSSVAFWLAGNTDGRALLAANQNHLANLLNHEALNHLITAGPNAGESVAYWLAKSPDGRALLAANQYRLANLLSQETLNYVIVAGAHAGRSVAFWLAVTLEGQAMLAANQNHLVGLLTQDTFNHVIAAGPSAGESVAYWLIITTEGRAMLAAHQHRLASLLSQETLNHVIAAGPNGGSSVAFWLARSPEGRALLAANQNRLANLLNHEALNQLITAGPAAGQSVAYWLVGNPDGRAMLAANQNHLVGLLSQETLNHVIAAGPNVSESVAFWLAVTSDGQAMLAANQNHLANLLNHEALNQLITAGPHAGESVAYWLAGNPDGRAMLAANQNRLANLLSYEALNQLITAGPNAGESVAFWLAANPDGRAMLGANQHHLANLLSQETLNHVIATEPNTGESVAFWLAVTPEGRAMLAANQHHLANLLSQETLNHVIVAGPYAGKSVAFWLAGNIDGRALLAANKNHLVSLLTQETLNHVIAAGPDAGKSVTSLLLSTAEGRGLLSLLHAKLIHTEPVIMRSAPISRLSADGFFAKEKADSGSDTLAEDVDLGARVAIE